ncbi:MotE family protein [Alkalicoccobacillus gibsonii]|jgi:flagellar protein FlbB|uniref:MotE family protein n=1 Tax=Alkalicoccobacillus gibsonii TaxID=79881 RepID=UPI001931C703|nr:hypothetical protein [Alkalicoccobacillus gibsonii]MBM0065155.1 hypothetical protein [Alkalicoccobacillus gibsonii]
MTKEDKRSSGLKTMLLAVVLPLIVVCLLVLFFVAPLFGFDVLGSSKQWAQDVPVLSSLVSEEEVPSTETPNDLRAENSSLQVELEQTKSQLEEATQRLEDTQEQLDQAQANAAEAEESTTIETTDMTVAERNKQLAKTYEQMSAKAAAAILNELTVDEILTQLKDVKTETRSAILAKMEAPLAADVVRAWSDEVN